jgi:hypothetical protein
MISCCACKADHSRPKQDSEHCEQDKSRPDTEGGSRLHRARADDKTYDAKMESDKAVKIEYVG